ncbi:unnamed protein product [Cuscuta epithymum]|uniref:Uncharacterized protein n=1 Tax=Cuscuta epithymum TaxID=186058 RepID=A0AAV0DC80_9ASTE|nr:unnamed protein product [Cuscuta epithymum]
MEKRLYISKVTFLFLMILSTFSYHVYFWWFYSLFLYLVVSDQYSSSISNKITVTLIPSNPYFMLHLAQHVY